MAQAVPLKAKLMGGAFGLLVALLYLVSYPFLAAYGYMLCIWASLSLMAAGKDALVIRSQTHSEERNALFSRVMSALQARAIILDYSDRERWPKLSLPVQLFWRFGPISIPPQFTELNLPAVILLRRFRFPLKFSFGSAPQRAEAEMDRFLQEVLRHPG